MLWRLDVNWLVWILKARIPNYLSARFWDYYCEYFNLRNTVNLSEHTYHNFVELIYIIVDMKIDATTIAPPTTGLSPKKSKTMEKSVTAKSGKKKRRRAILSGSLEAMKVQASYFWSHQMELSEANFSTRWCIGNARNVLNVIASFKNKSVKMWMFVELI